MFQSINSNSFYNFIFLSLASLPQFCDLADFQQVLFSLFCFFPFSFTKLGTILKRILKVILYWKKWLINHIYLYHYWYQELQSFFSLSSLPQHRCPILATLILPCVRNPPFGSNPALTVLLSSSLLCAGASIIHLFATSLLPCLIQTLTSMTFLEHWLIISFVCCQRQGEFPASIFL